MRKTLASKNNLTFCSLLIIVATLSSGYVLAQSALETDEMAGKCALYALIRGQPYTMDEIEHAEDSSRIIIAAFAMASNHSRAAQFFFQGGEEFKELIENNQWQARKYAFIGEHRTSCTELRIFHDY